MKMEKHISENTYLYAVYDYNFSNYNNETGTHIYMDACLDAYSSL